MWPNKASGACFLILGPEHILPFIVLKEQDPDFSSERTDT
jgi:hypothetical protein